MSYSWPVAPLFENVPTLRGLLHASLHPSIGHTVRIHVLVSNCHVVVRSEVVSNSLSVANWAILVAHQ